MKGGADAGVWDPKSANSSSGAAGLTQFIEATWCEMACKAGTRLNAVAQQKAFVSANGEIAAGRKGALLDLRFDPTLSIDTAAEYGLANLALLQKDKLVPADAGDDERAWFMYLAHHEGPAGAEQFLRKQGTVAFDKFVAQVGQDRASEMVSAAQGDVTLAYRNWLTGYIDQKIQPSRFRLAKAPATSATPSVGSRALGQVSADTTVPLSVLGGRIDLVLEIQQRLSDLGYLDPPADGKMGPTSDWALAEFCKLNGLSLGGGFTRQVAQTLMNPTAHLPEIRPGDGWIDHATRVHAKPQLVRLPASRLQEHHLSRGRQCGWIPQRRCAERVQRSPGRVLDRRRRRACRPQLGGHDRARDLSGRSIP